MAAEAARLPGHWVIRAAVVIAALNLFDGIFTLAFLQLGLCREANPVMGALYDWAPWAFMAVKMLLVNVSLVVPVHLRARLLARVALAACTGIYAALAVYELRGLLHAASS